MSTRFVNIKSFTHNNVAYTTLETVNVDLNSAEITDMGDNDQYTSFGVKGPGQVKLSLTMKDPVQAQQLVAAGAANVTFKGIPETGGTEITCTIQNAQFCAHKNAVAHGKIWVQSVTGFAFKTDGTNPVSYA